MVTIAVVGPGGVGGLLGAILSRAGHDITFVARESTAAVLNAHGLSVSSIQFGDWVVPAPAAPTLTAPADLVIVATKAPALASALAAVPPDAANLVLPLLNGVDHMAVLRSRYPSVVAGAIRVESTRVAPGRIEHTSPFSTIDLAPPSDRVDWLASLLRTAGLDVNIRRSEDELLWDKLALLAPLALLTTAARAPIGEARTTRRADLLAVIAEVTAIARAHGAPTDAAHLLAVVDRLAPSMKSSMLRDHEAGRDLELDAIGGAVLRAGTRVGIPTPATARLVAELR
jgi:2-dehydropantoate 2-reductase